MEVERVGAKPEVELWLLPSLLTAVNPSASPAAAASVEEAAKSSGGWVCSGMDGMRRSRVAAEP